MYLFVTHFWDRFWKHLAYREVVVVCIEPVSGY